MVYSGIEKPERERSVRAMVRLRYSAALVDCEAVLKPDKTAELIFDKPQRFSPGQSAVLYVDNTVICGGIIEK